MVIAGIKIVLPKLPERDALSFREATKKFFFSDPATKRGGGGVRAWPLRMRAFFEALERKFPNKDERNFLQLPLHALVVQFVPYVLSKRNPGKQNRVKRGSMI